MQEAPGGHPGSCPKGDPQFSPPGATQQLRSWEQCRLWKKPSSITRGHGHQGWHLEVPRERWGLSLPCSTAPPEPGALQVQPAPSCHGKGTWLGLSSTNPGSPPEPPGMGIPTHPQGLTGLSASLLVCVNSFQTVPHFLQIPFKCCNSFQILPYCFPDSLQILQFLPNSLRVPPTSVIIDKRFVLIIKVLMFV